MIENVPAYVSVLFMITAFVTVAIFGSAVRKVAALSFWAKAVLVMLPFWMIFQAVLAIGGFYLESTSVPPRLAVFGPFPAFLFVILIIVLGRNGLVDNLSLKALTIVHIVRLPVEFVLDSLGHHAMVPPAMTFHGWNFDIILGLTAPAVFYLAFRGGSTDRAMLLAWNIFGLIMLSIIVVTAFLAFPGPIQMVGMGQPNRAVAYFPYVWLPTVIVPIVLFSHLASIYKLATNKLS